MKTTIRTNDAGTIELWIKGTRGSITVTDAADLRRLADQAELALRLATAAKPATTPAIAPQTQVA